MGELSTELLLKFYANMYKTRRFEEEMFYHCLGTLPELFDGNPPFHGRGAISYAMNVAEILRVVKLVEKYII